MTKDNEPVAYRWKDALTGKWVLVNECPNMGELFSEQPLFAAPANLAAKVAELEAQRDELLAALEKIAAKDKAVSFERCMDCDYPEKCGRKTGCLSIKDHSPIANAAIAAARKEQK